MAQATKTYPDLTYEEVSDTYSKFKADVWPSNIDGVKYLKLDINRPFRNTDELRAWLNAMVAKLAQDLEDMAETADD